VARIDCISLVLHLCGCCDAPSTLAYTHVSLSVVQHELPVSRWVAVLLHHARNMRAVTVLIVALVFAALCGVQVYCGARLSVALATAVEGFGSNACPVPGSTCAHPRGMASIHVINMDKSTERWAMMVSAAKAASLPLERFSAVDARELRAADAEKLYTISPSILKHLYSRSEVGAVGCFLSHRYLLEHLASSHAAAVDDNYGHFILEDGAILHANFTEKWLDVWAEIQTLQEGWDMVFLGLFTPSLKGLANHTLLKVIDKRGKNHGTHGYVVRHGSLPLLLRETAVMNTTIDFQYMQAGYAGRIKWFAVSDYLVYQGSKLGMANSTIRGGKK
jgi:GR25 family glycosyltransferase involved in LPS biosynthesis